MIYENGHPDKCCALIGSFESKHGELTKAQALGTMLW